MDKRYIVMVGDRKLGEYSNLGVAKGVARKFAENDLKMAIVTGGTKHVGSYSVVDTRTREVIITY